MQRRFNALIATYAEIAERDDARWPAFHERFWTFADACAELQPALLSVYRGRPGLALFLARVIDLYAARSRGDLNAEAEALVLLSGTKVHGPTAAHLKELRLLLGVRPRAKDGSSRGRPRGPQSFEDEGPDAFAHDLWKAISAELAHLRRQRYQGAHDPLRQRDPLRPRRPRIAERMGISVRELHRRAALWGDVDVDAVIDDVVVAELEARKMIAEAQPSATMKAAEAGAARSRRIR